MSRHIIGILLFGVILVGCNFIPPSDPLKSDSEVFDEFVRHHSEYSELVELIREDKFVFSVNQDFVLVGEDWPTRWWDNSQPEFSFERWEKYKSVFNRLPSSKYQWVEKKNGLIVFSPMSSASQDIDGSYEWIYIGKGLAYSEVPLPTVDSLDSLGFTDGPDLYKNIGDGWYVYRDTGIGKPE